MKKIKAAQVRHDRTLAVAKHIIATRCTVRQAGYHFNVSSSTVHKDMRELLPTINPLLAGQVESIMEMHKAIMHLRGGEATKVKWNKRKAALASQYQNTWA
jgi:putative DeoR family transcriptional regulator (stage III sporulation protein D)